MAVLSFSPSLGVGRADLAAKVAIRREGGLPIGDNLAQGKRSPAVETPGE